MRLEQYPIVLGVIVALMGVWILYDAAHPEGVRRFRERRRRMRAERNRRGQSLIGLGTLGMAAVLIGRDTSRYGTLAALAGALAFGIGAWLNYDYLKELLTFRGAARRQEEREPRDPIPVSPGLESAGRLVEQPAGAKPAVGSPPPSASNPAASNVGPDGVSDSR
jgi:hypothetical protein